MVKKVISAIGIWFILSYNFLCIESFLYGLREKQNTIFYPAFVLFLLIVIVIINVLNKLEFHRKFVNDIITLGAVFTGLFVLALL